MNWLRHKIKMLLGDMVIFHYREALHGYANFPNGTMGWAVAEFHERRANYLREIRNAIP